MAKSRVREVLTTASDPLAVLVEIASNSEVDVSLRIQAAGLACPYIFPRLSAAVVATVPSGSSDEHTALVARVMGKIERLAGTQTVIEAAPATDKDKERVS